jgi:hypothetical protein
MTVPWWWMRYRGHSWERGGEMAAAMNLPPLPLLVLDWFDAIPARGVLGLQMVLMIPAMLGVMLYRREEYNAPHRAPAPLEVVRRSSLARIFSMVPARTRAAPRKDASQPAASCAGSDAIGAAHE